VCDGMDLGNIDKRGRTDLKNLPNYIGAKYISSKEYDQSK